MPCAHEMQRIALLHMELSRIANEYGISIHEAVEKLLEKIKHEC